MNLIPITAKVRPGHAKALRVDNAQFGVEQDIIVATALTQFFQNNKADARQVLYLAEAQTVVDGEYSIGVPTENILSVDTMTLMTNRRR